MSFFHKKNVTKCLGHHYAIWTSDSNVLLAQIFFSGNGNWYPMYLYSWYPIYLYNWYPMYLYNWYPIYLYNWHPIYLHNWYPMYLNYWNPINKM